MWCVLALDVFYGGVLGNGDIIDCLLLVNRCRQCARAELWFSRQHHRNLGVSAAKRPLYLRRAIYRGGSSGQQLYRLGDHAEASARATDICGLCATQDRKSTRLNSSHVAISYAVFCLKKKKNEHRNT